MRLHIKYQGTRFCGFRQEKFFMFAYISLCKTCDPDAALFLAHKHNLNQLGRGLLVNATYQISRLYALWFQTSGFYSCFPI